MTNVVTEGLRSGALPNVYIENIILESGARELLLKGEADPSDPPQKIRFLGNVKYEKRVSSKMMPEEELVSGGSLRSTVVIVAQDVFRTSRGSRNKNWILNSRSRQSLKAVLLQSSNSDLSADLTRLDSFDNTTLSRVLSKFIKGVDYQMKEASFKGSKIFSEPSQGNSDVIASAQMEMHFSVFSSNPKHLTYFAFGKLVGQGQSSVNPHTPVMVEKVFEDSSLISNSYIYREATNAKIWPGPVHYHSSQGWMKGAYHTSTPHGTLLREVIPNYKIIDKSILETAKNLTIGDLSVSGSNFTPASIRTLTRTKGGNIAGVFNFDLLEYMAIYSRFAALYRSPSSQIRNSLLGQTKISNLSIKRQRVLIKTGGNRLQSAALVKSPLERNQIPSGENVTVEIINSSEDNNNILKPQSKYNLPGAASQKFKTLPASDASPQDYNLYGEINELVNFSGHGVKTYTFIDGGISQLQEGSYEYIVSLNIQDGAVSYLQSRLKDLKTTIKYLNEYLAEAQKGYVSSARSFRPEFIKNYNNNSSGVQVWLGAIAAYVSLLELLSPITPVEKERLLRALALAIGPTTGTPAGISSFIELLNSLEVQLSQTIGLPEPLHTKEKSSAWQLQQRRSINVEFSIGEISHAQVSSFKDLGLDYLGINAPGNGILSIKKTDFVNRVNTEVNRYKKNMYNKEELTEFNGIGEEEVRALFSENNKYSYIAPASFGVLGKSINLLSDKIDTLDYASATSVIFNMSKNPSSPRFTSYPNPKAFSLLQQGQQGKNNSRIDEINQIFVQHWADATFKADYSSEGENKVFSAMPKTLGDTSINGENPLVGSDDLLGRNNKFASSDLKKDSLTKRSSPDRTDATSLLVSLVNREMSTANTLRNFKEISFDLQKDNNIVDKLRKNSPTLADEKKEIAKRIVELPLQEKLLTLNRQNFYDKSQEDAQADGFTYNFNMLRVVEFWSDDSTWKKLDNTTLDSLNKPLMVRVKDYKDSNIDLKVMKMFDDINVFNDHFILVPDITSPQPSIPKMPKAAQIQVKDGRAIFILKDLEKGTSGALAKQLLKLNDTLQGLGKKFIYSYTHPPKTPVGINGKTEGLGEKSGAGTQDSSTVRTGSGITSRRGGY